MKPTQLAVAALVSVALATPGCAAADKTAAADRAAAEAAASKAAQDRAAAQVAASQAAQAKASVDAEASATAAREAAQQAAAAKAAAAAAAAKAAGHTLTGAITEPDINGALVTRVGGYPGQALSGLTMSQLNKMGSMLDAMKTGRTYACPEGSGGGYEDIARGGQVVIRDGNGSILATTSLLGGTLGVHGCTFAYSAHVPDVPFYEVTVTHRGALTYSKQQLAASRWHIASHV